MGLFSLLVFVIHLCVIIPLIDMEVLALYREAFLEHLEEHCNLYKVIGMGTKESPMWFQLSHFNCMGNYGVSLDFKSSQCGLNFSLPLIEDEHKWDIENIGFKDVYDYFRTLKYNHIRENHPTIYKELRG